MKINAINNTKTINFRGPLDGFTTNILRACDMNEMVNAVGLDIGAMVIPRAYYDTKKRNEYAGCETFIREISGTFINCLSVGIFAKWIARTASQDIMPNVKINPKSWFSNDSIRTLKSAWNGDITAYVNTVLDNMSGREGKEIRQFKDINWEKVEWIDEEKWNKIEWKNQEYKDIHNTLKTKSSFTETMVKLINDNNIAQSDKEHVLDIIGKRLVNALHSEREIEVNIKGNKWSARMDNILCNTYDMGKDIFKTGNINQKLEKIIKVNKMKSYGAIIAASALGLTNQYLNRKITEKRTGKKGFVGEIDFAKTVRCEHKKDDLLWLKKLGASVLMAGMVFGVMRVKNFKDFLKKLECTGPVTSGNAIKTVYASTIIGRFMAADNGTELRESMTRDYLGFLNWLVFGGFAAKGVANLLDKKGENLFNYRKEGKGLKHWLNDMTLKTHNEIASKGKNFAKKNMWKLNFAQGCGIAYSAITLGILLPMLNAKVTEHKAKKNMLNNY